MAIRITGMYSGLDTESIISELVSAQSVKKSSLTKAQTKLSWKQDAWKALNTKIYNFYTNVLDGMRFQASYQKKTTKVSNSNAVSVVTGAKAVNGVQDLKITNLAKQGYLTGADLSKKTGKTLTASSTMADLGITSAGSFSVAVGDKYTDINVDENTTIAGLVNQLKAAGLNASFDEKSQRFFVSSQNSGEKANFNLVGNNMAGMDILSSLGMLTAESLNADAYKTWADDYGDGSGNFTAAGQAAIDAEILKRAEAYKKENDSLTEENKSIQEQLDALTAQKSDATLTADDIKVIDDKMTELQTKLNDNTAKIADNAQYFSVTQEDGKDVVSGTTALETKVKTDFDQKINDAKAVVNNLSSYTASDGATKVKGQDALITLNGAEFTSSTNTFEINGLTMTMLAETSETITLSTGEDTEGIYNMIKDFFTEYNNLIKEMDTLYNADSSKGYDPLTSEEKDSMSDSEIEEWEKKIKESLLRRDSTLGTVKDAMKSIMLKGATVNGKQMYLSDFGINTLGYFNAGDNEKGVYHIDGDTEDANTKNEEDKLRAMIASDPDSVISFFTQLANNMHDDLMGKMSATTMSSAFTVYNDKEMKEEYDAYTEKIAKQESKLNDLMDKWYSKFSKMETALAKLESKNSAISGMFSG
ncbi:MAG: flagellar filament capping protein FliD [Bacillus sp. (in: Bacteria)]|nr:flagellar filament capping protein FliD [Bacillus sp. (in: firmicutes)]MCM1426691.1 flagellar filament capping protein FliD [Eubacterium sp.]